LGKMNCVYSSQFFVSTSALTKKYSWAFGILKDLAGACC